MALLLFLAINELVIQSAIVIDDVIKYRKSRVIVDNIKPVIKSNFSNNEEISLEYAYWRRNWKI